MYAGRIVEIGPVRDVIRAPAHPYTRGLLSTRGHGSVMSGAGGKPNRDAKTRLPAIPGSPPDLANLPPGCAFAARCASAIDQCRAAVPSIETVAPGHDVRCILANARTSPP
jgi:peptide/nickel transport system ATP-binding protein